MCFGRSTFLDVTSYNQNSLITQESKMLYEDDDDIFMGSPRSKFFDILFNANKDLVKTKLLHIIDKYNAMEILLERELGEDVDNAIANVIMNESDAIHHRNNDFFIATVGEILTQNE